MEMNIYRNAIIGRNRGIAVTIKFKQSWSAADQLCLNFILIYGSNYSERKMNFTYILGQS